MVSSIPWDLLKVLTVLVLTLVILAWLHYHRGDSGGYINIKVAKGPSWIKDKAGAFSASTGATELVDKGGGGWSHDGAAGDFSAATGVSEQVQGVTGPFLAVVMGDWGTGPETSNGHDGLGVSKQLEKTVQSLFKPQLVISTGDQMYDWGVESTEDPLFKTHFEEMYTTPELNVPWLMSIGNHDCLGSVQAEVDYTKISDRWEMPSRYYAKEYLQGTDLIRIVVLDACLLICSIPDSFRCEDKMQKNLDGANPRNEHYKWIKDQLAVPARWKIVVAHWPIYSFLGNGPSQELKDNVLPLLVEHGVQLYFCGHDHGLQHTKAKSGAGPDMFVSGGGGYRIHPGLKDDADAQVNVDGQSIFKDAVHGFGLLNITHDQAVFNYVNLEGEWVYKAVVEQKR